MSATATENAVNTGGILYDKYLNIRKKLLKYKIIAIEDLLPDDIPILEQDENILWLRHNTAPEDDVKKKWSNSYRHRDPCLDVRTYFAYYACLRSTVGHVLLSIDFDKSNPEAISNFKENWCKIACAIVLYAGRKKKINSHETKLIDLGKTEVAALLCLPNLLGVLVRKRRKLRNYIWKLRSRRKRFFYFECKVSTRIRRF